MPRIPDGDTTTALTRTRTRTRNARFAAAKARRDAWLSTLPPDRGCAANPSCILKPTPNGYCRDHQADIPPAFPPPPKRRRGEPIPGGYGPRARPEQ